VHTLVAAILLRLAGFDALDRDAEPEPPDGELGEIEQSIRTGEGDAVIGSDGRWQAALGKQLLEGGKCEVFAGGFEGFTQQQEARSVITDGERIAIMPVAELELALSVKAESSSSPSMSRPTARLPPYSMTSSARASSCAGTSSPSVFAVLRLITSSYLVGACTGRSAGFSPLRMRST